MTTTTTATTTTTRKKKKKKRERERREKGKREEEEGGGAAKTKYTGKQASEKCTGFNETMNTSDEAGSSLAARSFEKEIGERKKDKEFVLLARASAFMAWPYFNCGRKRDGKREKGREMERGGESRKSNTGEGECKTRYPTRGGDSRNAREWK